MITIRPLRVEDLESAGTCNPHDYELAMGRMRWHLHTRYAAIIGAVLWDDEVIAVGCCYAQGDHGRITMLRVSPDHPRETLHAQVAEALIAHLEQQGCSSLLVTVTPADAALWTRHGFAEQEKVMRYSGGKFYQATRDEVDHLEAHHRMAVHRMDLRATGQDRIDLLMEHAYLGRVYLDCGTVRGFALALLGEGLTVADSPEVGLELQRWHFPIQEYILLPESNAAHEHLTERGYKAELEGLCMVRGKAVSGRKEMVYAEPYGAI